MDDDTDAFGRRKSDTDVRGELDELQALVVSQNELLDEFHTTVREQAELVHEGRRRLREAAIGYLILLIVTAAALFVLEQRDKTRLRDAQAFACAQANIGLDQGNRTAELLYAATYAANKRERQLAESSPTAAERKTHRQGVEATQNYANHERHVDAVNCEKAIDNPKAYAKQRPVLRPFTPSQIPEDLKPPK